MTQSLTIHFTFIIHFNHLGIDPSMQLFFLSSTHLVMHPAIFVHLFSPLWSSSYFNSYILGSTFSSCLSFFFFFPILSFIYTFISCIDGFIRTPRNLVQFHRMIACETNRTSSSYYDYGCYCGYGGGGEPVDETDK